LGEQDYFYMPTWNLDEMRILATLYPSSKHWEKVFAIIGGIPRKVLQHQVSECKAHVELKRGAEKCDLQRIQSLVSADEVVFGIEQGDSLHCVVHIHSEHPFHDAYLGFATDLAIYYLCQKLESQWNTLTTGNVDGHLMGQLLGGFLEYRGLEVLSKGVKIHMRETSRSQNQSVKTPFRKEARTTET